MQPVQVEFWQLLGMIGSALLLFVGAIWAMGKLFLSQVDRRLEEKFANQEKSRLEATVQWKSDFERQHTESREVMNRLSKLENDFTNRQGRLEERVFNLEESEKSHSDMYEMINKSNAVLEGLKATLEPIKEQMRRISDYLWTQGVK